MSKITLKTLTTRELLAAYRTAIRCCGPDHPTVLVGSRLVKGGDICEVWASDDEIKAELDAREHVASKREGKLIRRLKAQTKMSEDQLRLHPKYGQLLVDVQISHGRRSIDRSKASQYQKWYGDNFGTTFKVV